MQYREMHISDYDGLIQLWKMMDGISLRDADSRDNIEKYLLRNPGLSFVTEDGSQLVGSIMAGHDGKRGYIQHLAVMPAQQKAGIASKLVELCISTLKTEGISKSHLFVLDNNETAKNFWKNRGWKEREDIKIYSFINGSNPNA